MFGGTAVGAFRAGLRRKWAKTWARPDTDFIGSVKPAIGLMLGQRGARAGRDKIGHGASRPRLDRFGACCFSPLWASAWTPRCAESIGIRP